MRVVLVLKTLHLFVHTSLTKTLYQKIVVARSLVDQQIASKY